jgi:hypothetical protein
MQNVDGRSTIEVPVPCHGREAASDASGRSLPDVGVPVGRLLSHRLASVLDMETIVGSLFWGGLLVLVSRWVMRSYRGASPRTPRTPARPAAPYPRPSVAPPTVEESARESGALVDGLIIGHHLTRTHYQDRLSEQAETIDALRADAADQAYLGGDDLDEVDDVGGYGAVDFADGLGEAGSDESDESGAADDPWDDDVFGYDEHDDY